jgi:small subunit ribosomal protein S20
MAHSAQAAKRARQNEALRLHNRTMNSAMKTAMKRVEDAIKANDKTAALESLRLAAARIDKCAKRRVIHPNNASRKKSSLASKIAKMA